MTPDSLPVQGKERFPDRVWVRPPEHDMHLGYSRMRTSPTATGKVEAEYIRHDLHAQSLARIAALEAENERLREALEDYACAGSPDKCRQGKLKDGSCVRMDCGRAAHDALKLSSPTPEREGKT